MLLPFPGHIWVSGTRVPSFGWFSAWVPARVSCTDQRRRGLALAQVARTGPGRIWRVSPAVRPSQLAPRLAEGLGRAKGHCFADCWSALPKFYLFQRSPQMCPPGHMIADLPQCTPFNSDNQALMLKPWGGSPVGRQAGRGHWAPVGIENNPHIRTPFSFLLQSSPTQRSDTHPNPHSPPRAVSQCRTCSCRWADNWWERGSERGHGDSAALAHGM